MGGEYEFALQLPQKEKEVGIAQVDEAGVTPEVKQGQYKDKCKVCWWNYRQVGTSTVKHRCKYMLVPEAKQVPLQRFLWHWLLLHLYCGDSVGELWWLWGVSGMWYVWGEW